MVQKRSVMAAITRYGFKYEGRPLFVKGYYVATMTLRFTCKCGGAISILLDWSGGADRFRKTETCGACGEVLIMREVPWVTPDRSKDIFYKARIAVKGDFTIANTIIIDGDVTWNATFYDEEVEINTLDGGSWELDELTFRRVAREQADEVRREMPVDLEDDDGEEEVKEEVEEEVEEGYNDDSEDSGKRDWRYIMENMEQEEENWLEKREKREERLERRRKKLAKERRKKKEEIKKIMECRPFSIGLCVLVEVGK